MTNKICGNSKAPVGWWCTRILDHEGPCAAVPTMIEIKMKIRFGFGDDPNNATCVKCFHRVSRHGINTYNNDGRAHCWDCIGTGTKECINE